MNKSAMGITEQVFVTYRPIILSRVKLFTVYRTRENAIVGRDDLTQEDSLWFIVTMQTQGLEAALRHRLSLHHALYEAFMRSYPLHMPYHAYAKHERMEFIPLDVCDSSIRAVEDDEHMTSNLHARMLYAMLTQAEKEVVDMKMQGMSIREIARAMNVSKYRVEHIINGMRNRLAAHNPMKQEG